MFDHWIVKLIADASPVVQTVMLILLSASAAAWILIWYKRSEFRLTQNRSQTLEHLFQQGTGLKQLYRDYHSNKNETIGLENIFLTGCKEFTRLRKTFPDQPEVIVGGSRRAMQIALSRELSLLDDKLPILATVASASPYIGLFGTVWGIMNSFRSLGNVQQATLAMVAPGISEALIATAMGLFAAIPAVIAYNSFATKSERLYTQFNNFIEELSAYFDRDARLHANDPSNEGELG